MPEVYFDPRSLETDLDRRASLRAKCVVVDKEVAFVSSAKFTFEPYTTRTTSGRFFGRSSLRRSW
jgi:hypothetical protein